MTTGAVRVVCRPEVGVGFALGGLRPLEATRPSDGARALEDLLQRDDVGVVLIEANLYQDLPDDVLRRLARRPVPLVVPFPSPAWQATPASADSYIVELLRQVIGYRVRLR